MINVLMIEDDPDFAQLLSEYLTQFNIKITNFENPKEALNVGIRREIRQKYNIPIIISSARGDLSDKVVGLQIGADDYLPKPYDPKEMHARIMSLIRRTKRAENTNNENINSAFKIDERKHEITYQNKVLTLTPAEYEILEYLIQQHGYSVSREQLVSRCKNLKDKDSKSLDVIIGRLRTKINDSSKAPKHIFSVRGIGYKLIG
ncbi:TPA: response regulator transcription factor [Campylobacter coli]|nr:response regulator transcription factor [Campylobacter coli]